MARRPARTYVPFRMSAGGLALIDRLAAAHHVTRSEVIRAAIAVGFTHQAQVEQRLRDS